MPLLILAASVLALAAFLFWHFGPGASSGAVFVLSVERSGEVRLQGSIPGKSDSDAREFVAKMDLPPRTRIWAHRNGPGLRLEFSSHVPDNLRQRTRNYLGT
ncbi:MAG: DUF3634 family protein [Nannocystaceae bacterium]|nr:DUF3634 family protein [Nannocystaceae bacterium]